MNPTNRMDDNTMMAYRSNVGDDWNQPRARAQSQVDRTRRTGFAVRPRNVGVALALVAWMAVGYNAAFRQSGPHPAPLFSFMQSDALRDDAVITHDNAARALPGDPAGPVRQSRTMSDPAQRGGLDTNLVALVQDGLNQRGYDVGTVDGVMGPRTRAAIAAFESASGLPETGEPGPALLARLSLDRIPGIAAPPARTPATAIKTPPTRPVATLAPQQSDPVRMVPTTPIRIGDLLSGNIPGNGNPESAPIPAVPVGDPMVLHVQSVLAELGYSPGRIDGIAGSGTQQAIARFRADRALRPGNEVSTDLVEELAKITGLTPGQ